MALLVGVDWICRCLERVVHGTLLAGASPSVFGGSPRRTPQAPLPGRTPLRVRVKEGAMLRRASMLVTASRLRPQHCGPCAAKRRPQTRSASDSSTGCGMPALPTWLFCFGGSSIYCGVLPSPSEDACVGVVRCRHLFAGVLGSHVVSWWKSSAAHSRVGDGGVLMRHVHSWRCL